jgi:hypothetical protein
VGSAAARASRESGRRAPDLPVVHRDTPPTWAAQQRQRQHRVTYSPLSGPYPSFDQTLIEVERCDYFLPFCERPPLDDARHGALRFVVRTVYPTVLPRIESVLTPLAESLIPALLDVITWAETHATELQIEECRDIESDLEEASRHRLSATTSV